jgi:hypothetical protein
MTPKFIKNHSNTFSLVYVSIILHLLIFKIHHIEGYKMPSSLELIDNNIFIMSKQLLQKYINDKTIMKIKNLKLDIIGFDEKSLFWNYQFIKRNFNIIFIKKHN